jgi:Uma2 family endonuclease
MNSPPCAPTMYDLPSEDPEDPGLPDVFHPIQAQLLSETFKSGVVPEQNRFIGTDLNLYYDSRYPRWYKRPDWFVALGVASSGTIEEMRWSYVIWQESVPPFLVVELLSPGTEDEDLGQTLRVVDKPPTKWQVYEQILRVPYYVLFDRYTSQLRIFKLNGTAYEELPLSEPKHWLTEIQLGLGVWEGTYNGAYGQWLRWYDLSGWIPTTQESREHAEQQAQQAQEQVQQAQQQTQQAQEQAQQAQEQAQQAQEQAQQAQEQAQQAQERAERLAAQLRSLGIDPDSI